MLVTSLILSAIAITMVTDNYKFEKAKSANNYPPNQDLKVAVRQILDEELPNRILDLNWDNVVSYFTFFESLDGYSVSNVAFNSEDVRFSLPATDNAEARLQKRPSYNAFLSYSTASRFRTSIILSSVTSIKGQIAIGGVTADGTGGFTTNNRKYGFYFNGASLYGVVGNGTNETTLLLQTITLNTTYNLTAKFSPGDKVVFFVDGVEKGVIKTNLPYPSVSGVAESNFFVYSIVNNETSAKTMDTSYFQYSQEKVKVQY